MQHAEGNKVAGRRRVAPTPYRTVDLHLDGPTPPLVGEGFRLCPLGVQFRAKTTADPYAEMSIDVVLPSDREDIPTRRITIQGIVVQCDPVGDGEYKVAMYFVDLDTEHYDLIREVSQCLPTLCPDCNLF